MRVPTAPYSHDALLLESAQPARSAAGEGAGGRLTAGINRLAVSAQILPIRAAAVVRRLQRFVQRFGENLLERRGFSQFFESSIAHFSKFLADKPFEATR
ncbi:MAG: hypothetical protein AAGJ46_09770 [Planctomycetota bacterium]